MSNIDTATKTYSVAVTYTAQMLNDFQVGQTVYVAEIRDISRRSRAGLQLSATPFRTNMGNVEVVEGWLGTTDSIDREAVGTAVITKIEDDGYCDYSVTIAPTED